MGGKYDREYRRCANACGDPFPEFVSFFKTYEGTGANVLDLGCGQGRDALMIARHGHRVVGVDTSPTGISQMVERATREALHVEGIVADVVEYEPDRTYDVVVLDRVLHMLEDDGVRQAVLEKATQCTADNGHVLIADTPRYHELIRRFFQDRSAWSLDLCTKSFVFAHQGHS